MIKPLIHKPSEELRATYSEWIKDTGLEGGEWEETNAVEDALDAQEPVPNNPRLEGDDEDEFAESDDGRSSFEAFKQWMGLRVKPFAPCRGRAITKSKHLI